MTQQQFNEACMYANSQLEEWQIQEALDFIGLRMPMPANTEDTICALVEEAMTKKAVAA